MSGLKCRCGSNCYTQGSFMRNSNVVDELALRAERQYLKIISYNY